jgi:hypothetical protein
MRSGLRLLKKKTDTVPQAPSSEVADHGFSYGVVYANEIAAAEINKFSHKFLSDR